MYTRTLLIYSINTSPHLSSSGPVAHKAKVHLLQLALSAATRLASFQLFHPSMRLSFSIVDRHVVFGRPTFLLPSSIQVNAVSHLLFLSIRRICPTLFHLLNLTSLLIVFNLVFARISRFDTTYGYRICRIRLKNLKKNISNFLLSPSFIFHVSLPYNNTGLTSVLKSLNLDLNVYIFELHICFSFMKDTLALRILLTMSSLPPPCFQTLAPRELYLSTSFSS